jgi:PHD/YefM family antitoxin component YafN of YafNO toxin-antitoxin module
MATSKKQNNKAVAHKLGKAQARQQFAPLVESLATNGGTIEITDYGKVAAVMLGYKDYISLLVKAGVPLKPKNQLRGSMVLIGDLEETTKEISKLILDSVAKTAAEL